MSILPLPSPYPGGNGPDGIFGVVAHYAKWARRSDFESVSGGVLGRGGGITNLAASWSAW